MDIEDIKVGYKLFIVKNNKSRKAEIIGIRKTNDVLEFYVHYIDLNRRLDEWVTQQNLDLSDPTTIEIPKKKKKLEETSKKQLVSKNTDENKETNKIKDKEEEYKMKNIKQIQFGKYRVEPWYFSPYPKFISDSDLVYICEFCLFYFPSEEIFNKHKQKCDIRHPPGKEIYRNNGISFFEIDGYTEPKFCRNLALLSKLFLDHKSLYYDIDVFLFYVLCRVDEFGFSIVGYFSKEKISEQGYNLACILTLPFEQRKWYGRILIDFSYMLSKKDNFISGPEKPLSDLGLLSYRTYWLETIVNYLMQNKKPSVDEISKNLYISVEDVVSTIYFYGILKLYKGKFVYCINEEQKQKAKKYNDKKLKEEFLKL